MTSKVSRGYILTCPKRDFFFERFNIFFISVGLLSVLDEVQ